MEDLGATEDGHVLKLGLPDGGAVVADDDQLGLAVSQALHNSLVAYCHKIWRVRSCFEIEQILLTNFVLAGANCERQLLVDVLCLLALLSHFVFLTRTKRVQSITVQETHHDDNVDRGDRQVARTTPRAAPPPTRATYTFFYDFY